MKTNGKSNRAFFAVVMVVTGMAILILEIIGAKWLAPYFGSSHFIWTNQIAVTMMAIASGYALGGRLSRREGCEGWISVMLMGGVVWMGAVLACSEKAAYFFLRFGLPFGSLLAALFLFFVPLTLLASLGPIVVSRSVKDEAGLGLAAGTVFALGTAGSFCGALLAGIVMIPGLANVISLFLAALVLFLLGCFACAWTGLPGRLPKWLPIVLGLCGLLSGGAGVREDLRPRVAFGREIARSHNGMSLLLVSENPENGYRYLLDDFNIQSSWHPESGQSGALYAYLLMELPRIYAASLERVLVVGLGSGFVPMRLAEEGASVEAVEINPAIVSLAREYFEYDDRLVRTHVGDARNFLHSSNQPYDVILLDAFQGDSMPSHLMTVEAFSEVRGLLNAGGVLVINCLADVAGEGFFLASMTRTLKVVFDDVRLHHAGQGNFFFVAGRDGALRRRREPDLESVNSLLLGQVREALDAEEIPTGKGGIVLRDDYNPVDYRDAEFRMKLRSRLAWMNFRKD